jgi:hypothetical protein
MLIPASYPQNNPTSKCPEQGTTGQTTASHLAIGGKECMRRSKHVKK